MSKRLTASLRRRLNKAINVSTLVSLLASLFTFAPMLPVRAAALESFSATLAQPIFSADWDTDPTYTNVSYTWNQTRGFEAMSNDPCMPDGSCFTFNLALQDAMVPDGTYQEFMATIEAADIVVSPMPANMAVTSVSVLDSLPSNGRAETLSVGFACTDTCGFATTTEYTLTIVNSPIQNMEAPVPYVDGVYSTTTHRLSMFDLSAGSQETELLTAITAVGKGMTVTASVDPTLSFVVTGMNPNMPFYTDTTNVDTTLSPDACDFGTLTPGVAQLCAFNLNIATNASAGYSIYVVQDQNMTFNGNTIKQYDDGTRVDDAAATTWQLPSAAQLAHLGYSSNDTSVFAPSGGTIAVWAGIPNIATAGQAPVITGLVADSASPGDDNHIYVLKVESAATLPQGTGYTHNQYFIVVGNF